MAITTKQGYYRKKGTSGQNEVREAPKTLASLVYDVERSSRSVQTSLANLTEKECFGYPAFSTLTAYAVDDVVFYDRKLWKFTSAHEAGAWDAEDVEAFDVRQALENADATFASGEKVNEVNLNNFAQTNGYYGRMRVGLADNIVGQEIAVENGYTLKATGYDPTQPELEFADGQVKMTEIQGRACAWNQLVDLSYWMVANRWTAYGGTLSASNQIITYTAGNAVAANSRVCILTLAGNPIFKVGHRYLMSVVVSSSKATKVQFMTNTAGGGSEVSIGANEKIVLTFVSNAVQSGTDLALYVNKDGTLVEGDTVEIELLQSSDLTLLNPTLAAKANLTVAEVEEYLASIRTPKPYYAQNAGTLLGAKMNGWQLRKTANLLNPTTHKAELFTYSYESNSNKYEVVGFDNLTGAALQFTPYAIGVAETITLDSNNKFTIPSAGTLEVVDAIEGTAFSGDISAVCVQAVYDGSKDEEWSAFDEDNVEIDSANIYYDNNGVKTQVFENGILKSTGDGAGDVHDRVHFDEIAKKWKSVKNVGDISLGEYTYTKQGNLYTTSEVTPANGNMISPRGKSIVWNQILPNGNFADGSTGWHLNNITIENNKAVATTGGETTRLDRNNNGFEFVINHKYIFIASVNTSCSSLFRLQLNGGKGQIFDVNMTPSMKTVLKIFQLTAAVMEFIIYPDRKGDMQSGDSIELWDFQIFDLTLMFGAGNEPATVEEFEAMFPLDYYAYDTGSLGIISDTNYVDAAAFKAAMAGVHVFNQLATPITHDTLYYKVGNDYLPMEEVFPDGVQGFCSNWASENLVEQAEVDGQPQSITPVTTEVFMEDLREQLLTVRDTYVSVETLQTSLVGTADNLCTTLNAKADFRTAIGGYLHHSNELDTNGAVTFNITQNA